MSCTRQGLERLTRPVGRTTTENRRAGDRRSGHSAGGSDLRDSPMVAQKAGTDAGKQPRVSAIGKVRVQAEKREEAGLAGDNAQDQRKRNR